jgi:hypothetical protein
MFCWFILQISDIGIANDKPPQPEVTPVIRFKIRSSVTNLNSPS